MTRKIMRRIVFGALVFVCVVALVALTLGARYYLVGHQVPAGQRPLAELTSGSIESLKAEFNQSADGVRIILLLSPT